MLAAGFKWLTLLACVSFCGFVLWRHHTEVQSHMESIFKDYLMHEPVIRSYMLQNNIGMQKTFAMIIYDLLSDQVVYRVYRRVGADQFLFVREVSRDEASPLTHRFDHVSEKFVMGAARAKLVVSVGPYHISIAQRETPGKPVYRWNTTNQYVSIAKIGVPIRPAYEYDSSSTKPRKNKGVRGFRYTVQIDNACNWGAENALRPLTFQDYLEIIKRTDVNTAHTNAYLKSHKMVCRQVGKTKSRYIFYVKSA